MDSVLPVLFLDDEGTPLEFALRGYSSDSSYSSVSLLIKKGGGILHVKRDGPHTILLEKPESRMFCEGECFSIMYITDCCEANRLLDLNKYRLNKNSKYCQDYDANLILLKKKSWRDIPLKRDCKSDVEDADESLYLEPRPSKQLKNIPRPYSDNEKKLIIDWIMRNKCYSAVGGNSIWIQMESEEVLEGRSWQSMKEHFRKQIMPSIKKFGLSEKHVKCFKQRTSLPK
ncbi:telomeric repeat-binding factor 2-interacting protein 1-like isoform X1 [Ischnura elegans]|uniref:telomeric repeat-binding factor 2-interacting protein 1-like isoform X1 n=1 Tax=Ischnura elegans TaxID=197161 RepID=UPI001ED89A38|nr:telomeric repeat-binding factor 2-interacting protein 1-like isoform X1 [Ischnura elegans]XP_046394421.1 telomeric repeat-binding factor 2-interacting protein 1-like isoform X1 [Ischnura elegans]